MEVSDNGSWYKKARNSLLVQLKVVYNASDKEIPDRYHRYCELVTDLEKLKRWYGLCSTSSSRPS